MNPTHRFTALMAAVVCVAAATPSVRADETPELVPAVGRRPSTDSFIRRTAFFRVSLWHSDHDRSSGCTDECGEPSACPEGCGESDACSAAEGCGESACVPPQTAASAVEPNPQPQPECVSASQEECFTANSPAPCEDPRPTTDPQPPAPSAKCVLPASCCESERAGVWHSRPCAEEGCCVTGTCGTACDSGYAGSSYAAGATCSTGCGCGCPGNGCNTGCLGRMFGGRAASCSCDVCDYCGKGQGATLFDRLFGCMTPSGACAQGAPLLGKYQITYAHQPDWADPRDSQAWAAQGYGMPITVPTAPVVRFTYNYSHGTPASRLTPLSTYNPATAPKSLYLQSWH